jgi:hypothetical protein
VVDRGTEEDLTPSRVLKVPRDAGAAAKPAASRCSVEYRIDPARAEDFLALMQESRRSRLRQGALDWQLLHDLYEPAATSSRSSTPPGPSTCAASTASDGQRRGVAGQAAGL